MQARVDFNADSSKYIDQQQLVYASRIRLNELMSDSKVTRFFIAADTSIVVNEGLEFASLNDNMLRTNTSLIEAASQQRLAELDVKTALSRNYPYLKLNAAYGYTQNRYGSGTTTANWSMGPSGGLSLGWTIFDGNRRREQKNARIMLANAKLQQQQIELSLRANLANFWQAYCNNIELTNLEKENLTAAKENHEIAMERYLLGDLSGIEMREAQKSLLDAEERILSAQYNTKLCEISLMQISGRILEYIDNITK